MPATNDWSNLPGFGTPTPPLTLPAFGNGAGSTGSLPAGGTSWGSFGSAPSGGGSWWDSNGSSTIKGISAIAPLVTSLFGSNPYTDKRDQTTDQLKQLATTLGTQGQSIAGQGQAALAPVLKYLQAVAGGDPAAINAETAPERAKVLDQYDTARKAIQFAPRGGGQASATIGAGAKAASDITSLTAAAHRQGVTDLGNLGKNLLDTGVTEQHNAASELNSVLQAYDKAKQERAATNTGLGSAIGSALSFAALFA
jgi:hypothetical protein